MNIIFLGMKHCGKSTCATAVANTLGRPCLDTDDLMSELHFDETGESLSAKGIFAKYGAEYFKALEQRTVSKLVNRLLHSSENYIIALGGGTPMNGDLVAQLKATGAKIIYLHTKPTTIFSRVQNNGPSRFLEGENPLENFITLAQEREPFYRQYAEIIIDTEQTKGVEDMIQQALAAVENLQKEEA